MALPGAVRESRQFKPLGAVGLRCRRSRPMSSWWLNPQAAAKAMPQELV